MNVGLGLGMNVGLNKTEKAVLGLLIEDSDRIIDILRSPETILWRNAVVRQIMLPGYCVN